MKIIYNKKEKQEMKALMDSNLWIMENAEFSASGDSTYCASHVDNK